MDSGRGVPIRYGHAPERFSDFRRGRARFTRRRVRRARDPHRLRRHARRARRDHQRLQGRRRRPALGDQLGRRARERRRSRTASPAGFFGTSAGRSSTRPASARRSPTARRGAAASSATRATSCSRRSAPTTPTCASTCPARSARRSRARSASCSRTSTPPAAQRSRSWTRAARRSSRSPVPAGPNGLSFVGVRFRDGERVAEVQVRAGSSADRARRRRHAADRPGGDRRRDLRRAAGRPRAAAGPPVRADRRSPASTDAAAARPEPRASLITLAKSVRRNRTLKVVLGSSVDTDGTLTPGQDRRSTSRSRRARRRSRFKVPANAKHGKQKLAGLDPARRRSRRA